MIIANYSNCRLIELWDAKVIKAYMQRFIRKCWLNSSSWWIHAFKSPKIHSFFIPQEILWHRATTIQLRVFWQIKINCCFLLIPDLSLFLCGNKEKIHCIFKSRQYLINHCGKHVTSNVTIRQPPDLLLCCFTQFKAFISFLFSLRIKWQKL